MLDFIDGPIPSFAYYLELDELAHVTVGMQARVAVQRKWGEDVGKTQRGK
jgi:hypothetical protein